MDITLYEASQLGNISTLYAQIRENVYVLEEIDEPPFGTTPLHIAAENGQIEFASAVVYLKPSFASKLDKNLFTPMHLALQKNKTEMALWLLRLDCDLVRVKGRDGTTPFLYEVEKGNTDILLTFLEVCPECIKDVNVRGENALHIALKCNSLEAFEALFYWLRTNTSPNSDIWEKELFKGKDKEGNTVLHTAASTMNHKAIQLLTTCFADQRKVKNLEDLTPLDILQNNEGLGEEQARNIKSQKLLGQKSLPDYYTDSSKNFERLKIEYLNSVEISTILTRKRMKMEGDTRNAMLVVTVLVITLVLQGVYSPAGGLSPTDDSNSMHTSPICNISCTNNTISPSCNVTCNSNEPISSTTSHTPHPGTSVMNRKLFCFTWFVDTYILILAYALTIYLIPPGITDALFNAILLGLGLSYSTALMTISPVSYLGAITMTLVCIYYFAFFLLFPKKDSERYMRYPWIALVRRIRNIRDRYHLISSG